LAQWTSTVLDEQNPRTDVRDRKTQEYTSTDPHRDKHTPETRRFVIKDIIVGEITATPVAGNRVQQAIGTTTQATEGHTQVETNRDSKITVSETPVDLIIITRDLTITIEDFNQTLITITNATGTTAHRERGPQYKTITHIVTDQHPLTSNQPQEILCAITATREGISLENVERIWLVSTTHHVAIS
jgi:hypothetical protein